MSLTLAQKLEKYSRREASGCVVWTLKVNELGYATIQHNWERIRVHRAAYELKNGPIPEGMVVCHRCDNPRCLNPDHLFLGTQQDNVLDCDSKGRRASFAGSKHGAAKLTENDALAIRHAGGSTTKADLATRFGVSVSVIADVLSGRSWTHVGGPRLASTSPQARDTSGANNARAKLSEQSVRSIFSDTRTHQSIADAWGVSKATVSGIKAGRKWAHLKLGETK